MIIFPSTADRTRIAVGGSGKAYATPFGPKTAAGEQGAVQVRRADRQPDLRGGMQNGLKGGFQS